MPSTGSMIHTRSELQPDQVVVRFLAEHRVTGPLGAQPAQQQRVGPAVAGVAEHPRIVESDLVAHRQQQLPGVLGQVGSQRGVGQVVARMHPSSIRSGEIGAEWPPSVAPAAALTRLVEHISDGGHVTRFATAAAFAVATMSGGSVIVAGCASAPEPYSLNGTSWQLVAIQSMDDAQGSTEVPDPGKFTVTFGEDGRAAFQLDCNRGSGSFEAKPSADGISGSLTFGPIATTLMSCPTPSLDQQVGAALPGASSYLIKDDQLHMSLFADGGILTWKAL